jgi:carbonic anhydrase
MELTEMVQKWPRWVEKYAHIQSLENANMYKFIFKREAMVSRDMDRRVKDEVAIKLLYGEARTNIMQGRYPLSVLT